MVVTLGPFSLDVIEQAMERVRERLLRASRTLEAAGVDYAVMGGHAVAMWVSSVGEGGVRNTRDVDLLIRRQDLPAARTALEAAGFIYAQVSGVELFLDGPYATPRDAVHILFANERVRPHDSVTNPDVAESQQTPDFRVLSLDALIRNKLTAFRLKDRMHLLDMIDLGLIDPLHPPALPPPLRERLQQLFDDPHG